MLEPFFFILGVVNNAFLIFIFAIRKKRTDILQRIGWVYLLLAIPAAYGIFLVVQEQKEWQYIVFLGIFLAFLALEGVYDFALRIPFRENWRQNWRLLIPYLCLYYAMTYGFVVMVWKSSLTWGVVMLALAITQIVVNTSTHPRGKGKEPESAASD